MGTGLAWDERCMWHDTGVYFGPHEGNMWVEPFEHPENAQSKRRIKNLLDASGLNDYLTTVDFRPASETDVLKVHTHEYLEINSSLYELIKHEECIPLSSYYRANDILLSHKNELETYLSEKERGLFDLKEHDITDESSMDNIDKWDSLGHLKLIMAIEKEFGFSIDTVDMVEVTSFTKIILYLKDNIKPGSD